MLGHISIHMAHPFPNWTRDRFRIVDNVWDYVPVGLTALRMACNRFRHLTSVNHKKKY